ncbi:Mycophenolic acid acyl-glucuronide esterase, mitochondrial [Amphibalanus amphitrite]|uniref:Mycophenolic acid acyl-glucuronide esterase, mitochondrial n=1 Tax=Amphibalanus amphitrite TaxID=1232801 RepID=A0A6A4X6A2_AMPAM|nr:Mycophenolic acid acyl-glucuronide esterase, mitochondrial [Amphibalanus amphitrite]
MSSVDTTTSGSGAAPKTSYFRKHNLSPTQYAYLGRLHRDGEPRRFAYCRIEGTRRPGIMYVPGYFSKMYIAKANIIEEFCLRNGYPFLKYDAEGIGESRTTQQREVSFSAWFEDACHALEHLTTGPQILVSSSNGAWMSLMLAAKYPERVHSILMLAPAVNHGLDDDLFETLLQSLDPETQARVEAGEAVRFKANWGVEVTCSKRFLQEMKDHRIDIDKPLGVQCPVRIIHAMEDDSVHWENCLDLVRAVPHNDVRLYLKKRGNHRLMTEEDFHLQMVALQELLDKYPVPGDLPPPPAPVSKEEEKAPASGPPREMAALPQSLMQNLFGEMGKRRSIANKKGGTLKSKL